MPQENTAVGAQAPAAPVGRYLFTAVVDGTSDQISAGVGMISRVFACAKVGVADIQATGPMPPNSEYQRLPLIPPLTSDDAAGVLLDLHENQEPLQLEADRLRAALADATADEGAGSATDGGANQPNPLGAGAPAVVVADGDARGETGEHTDPRTPDGAAVNDATGASLESVGVPVQDSVVVADHEIQSVGALEASAALSDDKMRSLLERWIDLLDDMGDHATADALSGLAKMAFGPRWTRGVTFESPIDAESPAAPDPSPHPEPTAVNPNAR